MCLDASYVMVMLTSRVDLTCCHGTASRVDITEARRQAPEGPSGTLGTSWPSALPYETVIGFVYIESEH